MTRITQHREFALPLEIREDDQNEGRTIFGIVAPFDSPAAIRSPYENHGETFTEVIKPGAFRKTVSERGARLKLMIQHDTKALPVGKATKLEETPDGLYAEFYVARTARGTEALQLVREGVVDGFSIGFQVVQEDWSRDGRSRTLREVALKEVSLVSSPAYEAALVGGVRGTETDWEGRAMRLALMKLKNGM